MDDHKKERGISATATLAPDQLLDKYLSERLTTSLRYLVQQAWRPSEYSLDGIVDIVEQLRGLRSAVATLAERAAPEALAPLYLVSSSFLREAFGLLTVTEDERLVYATGPEDGASSFALTRLVTFDLANVSVVGAAPEPRSHLESLTELEENGERILATFHSHPGNGATTPSSTDLATQEGLEKLGYPTIGAVFSRDGFIRFYSQSRPFRVVVSGTGIETVEEHLFRLDQEREAALLFGRER